MAALRGHAEFYGLDIPGQPKRLKTWVRHRGVINVAVGEHRPISLPLDEALALHRHLQRLIDDARTR
jgi:hypothetical protein